MLPRPTLLVGFTTGGESRFKRAFCRFERSPRPEGSNYSVVKQIITGVGEKIKFQKVEDYPDLNYEQAHLANFIIQVRNVPIDIYGKLCDTRPKR